jgi:hypothetical protein
MFSIINHQGNTNQNHSSCPSKNSYYQNQRKKMPVRMQRKDSHTLTETSTAVTGNRMAVPQTTEVELTHDLPILLLGMYPKKLK